MVDPTPPPATGEASADDVEKAWCVLGYLSERSRENAGPGWLDTAKSIAREFASTRTAARAEAIRECIKVTDDAHAEYSGFSGLTYEYGRWSITDIRDRLRKLLASEPARAKGGG